MKQTILILIAFFTINSCQKANIKKSETCQISFADSSHKHPQRLFFEEILKKYHKKGLPGISILIHDENGVWIGSIGKADIENNVNFKPCTVSKVASITKMMFATAVMQLVEQGKINLDDKINLFIDKEIIKNVKNSDNVTIRDLMRHTTGIFDIITTSDFYLAVLNNPNKKWTGKELIKFAYGKEPYHQYDANKLIGHYSNTNTLLLSMVVEKIMNRPHNEIFNELVMNKLNLKNTYYQSHDELPSSCAQGYFDLYNNGTIINVSNLITGSGNGYGGIYSNIFDLHTFMKALFIDKTLVSPSSFTTMNTFFEDDENGDLGIGLLSRGKKNPTGHIGIGHTGRDLGYSGAAFCYPTKNNRIAIHLVNYGTNGDTKLRKDYYELRDELAEAVTKY